jgi:HD-like signal output (HDOD) protein
MAEQISQELLEHLVPINDLSPGARERLVARAQVAPLARGARLTAGDERPWLVYLLDGDLSLVAKGTPVERIVAGAERARRPVFGQSGPADQSVASVACKILRIDRQLFEALLSERALGDYEVVDIEVSGAESTIFQEIYQASQLGELKLPSMPEVAMAIRRVMDDPKASVAEVARIVQTDPVVAGGLIQAANSPLYRGTSAVRNVHDAVVRIGLDGTRQIVTSLAMRNVFKAKLPALRKRMHELWRHSVNVSVLSFVIARSCPDASPERALLAGLLHDIGIVPIITHVENKAMQVAPRELEETVAKLRGIVGGLVLDHWRLNSEFTDVVYQAEEWLRDPGPRPDYCDIVLLAQLFALSRTQKDSSLPEPTAVPAFRKLSAGAASPDMLQRVFTEARAEMGSLKQLLGK